MYSVLKYGDPTRPVSVATALERFGKNIDLWDNKIEKINITQKFIFITNEHNVSYWMDYSWNVITKMQNRYQRNIVIALDLDITFTNIVKDLDV